MKNKIAHRLMVIVAAAAPVIGGLTAQAQQRVENGRANDANNRIGSGGYNDPRPNMRRTVTGNQIVTGNVTGGKEFRGPVGYVDEHEFRGPTASGDVSDPFIRGSAGVPERTTPSA